MIPNLLSTESEGHAVSRRIFCRGELRTNSIKTRSESIRVTPFTAPHQLRDGYRDVRAEALAVGRERSLEVGAFAAPQPIAAGLVAGHRLSLDVEREHSVIGHGGFPGGRRDY